MRAMNTSKSIIFAFAFVLISVGSAYASNVNLKLSSSKLDIGQTLVLNATLNGNVSSQNSFPYTYVFTIINASSNSKVFSHVQPRQYANYNTFFYVTNMSGTFFANVVVVTGSNSTVSSLDSNNFVISPKLSDLNINPKNPSYDVGQQMHLNASWSGGTSPYSIEWYFGGNALCSANKEIYSANLSGNYGIINISDYGSGHYCVNVQDSSGIKANATSSISDVLVYNALSINNINAEYNKVDQGQTIVISGNVSGGSGLYKYDWFAEQPNSSTFDVLANHNSTLSLQTSNNSALGLWKFKLQATDMGITNSYSLNSSVANVTVEQKPSVSIHLSNLTIGGKPYFTANATGGTGKFSYEWSVNGNKTNDNSSTYILQNNSVASGNSISLSVAVKDDGASQANPAVATYALVQSLPIKTAPLGLSKIEIILIFIGMVLVIAIIFVLVIRSRKTRKPAH